MTMKRGSKPVGSARRVRALALKSVDDRHGKRVRGGNERKLKIPDDVKIELTLVSS